MTSTTSTTSATSTTSTSTAAGTSTTSAAAFRHHQEKTVFRNLVLEIFLLLSELVHDVYGY